jgi:hypothetical protein
MLETRLIASLHSQFVPRGPNRSDYQWPHVVFHTPIFAPHFCCLLPNASFLLTLENAIPLPRFAVKSKHHLPILYILLFVLLLVFTTSISAQRPF